MITTNYTFNYDPIHVKQSTFKAGLSAKVHRWFRLTPSYAPDLVQEMIQKLGCSKGDTILDPFSGASTTLIESQLEGYNCYGFEINPFLHWVGQTCCNWSVDVSKLTKYKNLVDEKFAELSKLINFNNLDNYGLEVPPIHNPHRWWNDDVITDLLILKKIINEEIQEKDIKDFFLLSIAAVLVPDLSNVTLGKLQLHFIDRSHENINVMQIFSKHFEEMKNDLVDIQEHNIKTQSKIFNTNSVTLENVKIEKDINCVITSPPYPNRYSYVWNTRPHLYFLDFITTGKEASNLDKDTIGGTWGTATSILNKGIIEPEFDFLKDVWDLVEDIRTDDNLMANYVMKYFNLLAKQIKAMETLPQKDLRCAYVVGNSRIKGRYIETDVYLAQIFEGLGYEISEIHRFRKRNSGKDLFESIVYARKNSSIN